MAAAEWANRRDLAPFISEGCAHLRDDPVRAVVDVGRCVAEKPISCVQKAVLAAVVFDEAVAMCAAVKLEPDPMDPVVQVGPANEATPVVVKGDLYFGTRESGQDEEHAKARLHRRLGRSVSQLGGPSSLSDPPAPSVRRHIGAKPHQVDESLMQRHVDCHNCLSKGQSAAQVEHGAEGRRDRETLA